MNGWLVCAMAAAAAFVNSIGFVVGGLACTDWGVWVFAAPLWLFAGCAAWACWLLREPNGPDRMNGWFVSGVVVSCYLGGALSAIGHGLDTAAFWLITLPVAGFIGALVDKEVSGPREG